MPNSFPEEQRVYSFPMDASREPPWVQTSGISTQGPFRESAPLDQKIFPLPSKQFQAEKF